MILNNKKWTGRNDRQFKKVPKDIRITIKKKQKTIKKKEQTNRKEMKDVFNNDTKRLTWECCQRIRWITHGSLESLLCLCSEFVFLSSLNFLFPFLIRPSHCPKNLQKKIFVLLEGKSWVFSNSYLKRSVVCVGYWVVGVCSFLNRDHACPSIFWCSKE